MEVSPADFYVNSVVCLDAGLNFIHMSFTSVQM